MKQKDFNLREELLREHSKKQCEKIRAWVGDDQQRFDELFKLFLKGEYRLTQRAAWPLSYCVQDHPGLIKKGFGRLVRNLSVPGIHDAVKRNTVRILQHVDIPKQYQGELMKTCFRYVASPREAIAIKVFALTVLTNLAELYPGIKNELKLLVEQQLPTASAGFRSRAREELRRVDAL
jgi:hypothetical protein